MLIDFYFRKTKKSRSVMFKAFQKSNILFYLEQIMSVKIYLIVCYPPILIYKRLLKFINHLSQKLLMENRYWLKCLDYKIVVKFLANQFLFIYKRDWMYLFQRYKQVEQVSRLVFIIWQLVKTFIFSVLNSYGC